MPSFHKTYCTYHWSKLPELSDIIKSNRLCSNYIFPFKAKTLNACGTHSNQIKNENNCSSPLVQQ